MKRLISIITILLWASMARGGMSAPRKPVVAATSGDTCSTTPFFEQTSEATYEDFQVSSIWAQGIANSTNRRICKISLYVDNANGTATNVTLAVRSTYNGGGTLYGDTQTISVPSGAGWRDWEWTNNYPETSSNIYINGTAAATGVWWQASTSTGQNLYYNSSLSYTNTAWRMRVYALQ